MKSYQLPLEMCHVTLYSCMLPKGNKKAVGIPNGAATFEVAAILVDDRMCS